MPVHRRGYQRRRPTLRTLRAWSHIAHELNSRRKILRRSEPMAGSWAKLAGTGISEAAMRSTHTYTCPLCEATCGLTIDVEGNQVVRVRGDVDDVFSRGFACPKGLTIGDLHHDPDRLRHPLVDGVEATWDEAWQAVAAR